MSHLAVGGVKKGVLLVQGDLSYRCVSGAGHLRHTQSRTVKRFRRQCSVVGIVTRLRAGWSWGSNPEGV